MPPKNLYAPDFQVLIDGDTIPGELRAAITSVSLTSGLEGADRVELAIANIARKWVDDPLLEVRKDKPFELELGYRPGALTKMFYGEITGLNASFPSSGVPQLTVVAQDRRHRMKKAAQNTLHSQPSGEKGNKPIPDKDLAARVTGTYGLTMKRDNVGGNLGKLVDAAVQLGVGGDPDTQQKGVRRQANETDYDLIRRVARESGCEMIVDHTPAGRGQTLRFMFPPGNTKPDVELTYGLSLIEFTPRESLVGQVRSVSTSLKVSATGEKHGVKLEVNDDLTELLLTVTPGPPVLKRDGNTAEDSVVLQEPMTLETAPRRLLAELVTRTNQRLTGSGSTVGDPRIRAGGVLRLGGMGARFGGLYRVTSATHSIDGGGYRTRFEVRKEIGLDGLKTDVRGEPAAKKPPKHSS